MGRLVTHLVALFLLATSAPPAAGVAEEPALALFPPLNRAGDSAATAVFARILRGELGRYGPIVGADVTRDSLRRLRVRDGDRAAPALLRLLGEELDADWLVSATLHDAERRQVPRLALSVRVYSSGSGELTWSGFRGKSGIDDRGLLGLGTIPTIEGLVTVTVQELLRGLPSLDPAPGPPGAGGSPAPGRGFGTVAIVPFQATVARRGTVHAETVTEATQARLVADGVRIVSPNLSHEILRRLQGGTWGGVTTETRAGLREIGADTILTGSVERYEVGGSEFEPEPRVTVAMRLLDAVTGRILWTGASEREGWDREGLFRVGRVYSRGSLTARIIESLVEQLDEDGLRRRE